MAIKNTNPQPFDLPNPLDWVNDWLNRGPETEPNPLFTGGATKEDIERANREANKIQIPSIEEALANPFSLITNWLDQTPGVSYAQQVQNNLWAPENAPQANVPTYQQTNITTYAQENKTIDPFLQIPTNTGMEPLEWQQTADAAFAPLMQPRPVTRQQQGSYGFDSRIPMTMLTWLGAYTDDLIVAPLPGVNLSIVEGIKGAYEVGREHYDDQQPVSDEIYSGAIGLGMGGFMPMPNIFNLGYAIGQHPQEVQDNWAAIQRARAIPASATEYQRQQLLALPRNVYGMNEDMTIAESYTKGIDYVMNKDAEIARLRKEATRYEQYSRSVYDISESTAVTAMLKDAKVYNISLPQVNSGNVSQVFGVMSAELWRQSQTLEKENLATWQDQNINMAQQMAWNIGLDVTSGYQAAFDWMGWSGKAMRGTKAAGLMDISATDAARNLRFGPQARNVYTPWSGATSMWGGILPLPTYSDDIVRPEPIDPWALNPNIPEAAQNLEARPITGYRPYTREELAGITPNAEQVAESYADVADPETTKLLMQNDPRYRTMAQADVESLYYGKYNALGMPVAQHLVPPPGFGEIEAKAGKNTQVLNTIERRMKGVFAANLNERFPYQAEIFSNLAETPGLPAPWQKAYGIVSDIMAKPDNFRLTEYGTVFTPPDDIGKTISELGGYDPRQAYQKTIYLEPSEDNFETIMALTAMSDQTNLDVDLWNINYDKQSKDLAVQLYMRPDDGKAIEIADPGEIRGWFPNEERMADFSANPAATTRAKFITDIAYERWNLYDNPEGPYANKFNNQTGFQPKSREYATAAYDLEIKQALFADFSSQGKVSPNRIDYEQMLDSLPTDLTVSQQQAAITRLRGLQQAVEGRAGNIYTANTPFENINELYAHPRYGSQQQLMERIQDIGANYGLNVTMQAAQTATLTHDGQLLADATSPVEFAKYADSIYAENAAALQGQTSANRIYGTDKAMDLQGQSSAARTLTAQNALITAIAGNPTGLNEILSGTNSASQMAVYEFAEQLGIDIGIRESKSIAVTPAARSGYTNVIDPETAKNVRRYGPWTEADAANPANRVTTVPGMANANPVYQKAIGSYTSPSGRVYSDPGEIVNKSYGGWRTDLSVERAAGAQQYQAQSLIHNIFMGQTGEIGAPFETNITNVDPGLLFRADTELEQAKIPYYIDYESARVTADGTYVTMQPGRAPAPARERSVAYRLDDEIMVAQSMKTQQDFSLREVAVATYGEQMLETWNKPSRSGEIFGNAQEQDLAWKQMLEVGQPYGIAPVPLDRDATSLIYHLEQYPEGKFPSNIRPTKAEIEAGKRASTWSDLTAFATDSVQQLFRAMDEQIGGFITPVLHPQDQGISIAHPASGAIPYPTTNIPRLSDADAPLPASYGQSASSRTTNAAHSIYSWGGDPTGALDDAIGAETGAYDEVDATGIQTGREYPMTQELAELRAMMNNEAPPVELHNYAIGKPPPAIPIKPEDQYKFVNYTTDGTWREPLKTSGTRAGQQSQPFIGPLTLKQTLDQSLETPRAVDQSLRRPIYGPQPAPVDERKFWVTNLEEDPDFPANQHYDPTNEPGYGEALVGPNDAQLFPNDPLTGRYPQDMVAGAKRAELELYIAEENARRALAGRGAEPLLQLPSPGQSDLGFDLEPAERAYLAQVDQEQATADMLATRQNLGEAIQVMSADDYINMIQPGLTPVPQGAVQGEITGALAEANPAINQTPFALKAFGMKVQHEISTSAAALQARMDAAGEALGRIDEKAADVWRRAQNLFSMTPEEYQAMQASGQAPYEAPQQALQGPLPNVEPFASARRAATDIFGNSAEGIPPRPSSLPGQPPRPTTLPDQIQPAMAGIGAGMIGTDEEDEDTPWWQDPQKLIGGAMLLAGGIGMARWVNKTPGSGIPMGNPIGAGDAARDMLGTTPFKALDPMVIQSATDLGNGIHNITYASEGMSGQTAFIRNFDTNLPIGQEIRRGTALGTQLPGEQERTIRGYMRQGMTAEDALAQVFPPTTAPATAAAPAVPPTAAATGPADAPLEIPEGTDNPYARPATPAAGGAGGNAGQPPTNNNDDYMMYGSEDDPGEPPDWPASSYGNAPDDEVWYQPEIMNEAPNYGERPARDPTNEAFMNAQRGNYVPPDQRVSPFSADPDYDYGEAPRLTDYEAADTGIDYESLGLPSSEAPNRLPPNWRSKLTTKPLGTWQYMVPGSNIRMSWDPTAGGEFSVKPPAMPYTPAAGGGAGVPPYPPRPSSLPPPSGSGGTGVPPVPPAATTGTAGPPPYPPRPTSLPTGSGAVPGGGGAGIPPATPPPPPPPIPPAAGGAMAPGGPPPGGGGSSAWVMANAGWAPGGMPTVHPLLVVPGRPRWDSLEGLAQNLNPFEETLRTKAVRMREEWDPVGSMMTSSTSDPKNWATMLRALAQDPENLINGIDKSLLPGMEAQANAAGQIAFGAGTIGNVKTSATRPIIEWGRADLESLAGYVEKPIKDAETGNYRPMNAVEFKAAYNRTMQSVGENYYGADITNPLTDAINAVSSITKRAQATVLNRTPGVWEMNALDANVKAGLEGYWNLESTPELYNRMRNRTGGVGSTERAEASMEGLVTGTGAYLGQEGRSFYRDMAAGAAKFFGYDMDATLIGGIPPIGPLSRSAQGFVNAIEVPLGKAAKGVVDAAATADEAGSRMWTENRHLMFTEQSVGFGEGANYFRTYANAEQDFLDTQAATWFDDTFKTMSGNTSLDPAVIDALREATSKYGADTSRSQLAYALELTVRRAGGDPADYTNYTSDILQRQDTLYNAGTRSAMAGAENTILEPSHQTNIDTWLGNIFAYSYFGTRTAVNWAERSIRAPKTLAMYERWEKASRVRNENEDNPTRYQGTLGINTPWGQINAPNIIGAVTGISKMIPNTYGEDIFTQMNMRMSAATQFILSGDPGVFARELVPEGKAIIDAGNTMGADWPMGPYAPESEQFNYARQIGANAYEDPTNNMLASTGLLGSQVAFDRQWGQDSSRLPQAAFTSYEQAKQQVSAGSLLGDLSRWFLGVGVKPAVDPNEVEAGRASEAIRSVGIGGMESGNPFASWDNSNFLNNLLPAAAVWSARNQSYPEQDVVDPLTGLPTPQPIERLWTTLPSLKLDSDKVPSWWEPPKWNMTRGALLEDASDAPGSAQTPEDTALYMMRDPKTKEVRYVGQTLYPSERYVQHIEDFNSTGFNHPKGIWMAEMLRAGTYPEMFVFDWISGGTTKAGVTDPVDKMEQAWIGYLSYGNDPNMGATVNVDVPDYDEWLAILEELGMTKEDMKAQMETMKTRWEPVQLASEPDITKQSRSPFPAFPSEVLGVGSKDYVPDEAAWDWISDPDNQVQAKPRTGPDFATWLTDAGPKAAQKLADANITSWETLARANIKDLTAQGISEGTGYEYINQANTTLLVQNGKILPPIHPLPPQLYLPGIYNDPTPTQAAPTSAVPSEAEAYTGGYGSMGVIPPITGPITTATALTAAIAPPVGQFASDWLTDRITNVGIASGMVADAVGTWANDRITNVGIASGMVANQLGLTGQPQSPLQPPSPLPQPSLVRTTVDPLPVAGGTRAAATETPVPSGSSIGPQYPGAVGTPMPPTSSAQPPVTTGASQPKTFQQTSSRVDPTVAAKAKELGIDPNLAQAVLNVESGGQGFVNDRLKIRFEPNVFNNQFLKNDAEFGKYFDTSGPLYQDQKFRTAPDQPWQEVHASQATEYAALNVASQMMIPNAKGVPTMASTQAIASTSMGAAQIMGFNYRTAGYESPEGMMADYAKGQAQQTASFFNYLENSGKTQMLRDNDITTFARAYNGPGNVETYTNRINTERSRLSQTPQPDLNLQRTAPFVQVASPERTIGGQLWDAFADIVTTAGRPNAPYNPRQVTPPSYANPSQLMQAGVDISTWLKSGSFIPPSLRPMLQPWLPGAIEATESANAARKRDESTDVNIEQVSDTYFYIPGWRPSGKPGQQIFMPTLPDGRKLWVPDNMLNISEDAPDADWLNNPQFDPNNPEGSLARIIEKYGQPQAVSLKELNSQAAYIDRKDFTSYDKPEVFGAGQNPLSANPYGAGGVSGMYDGAPGGRNYGPTGAPAGTAGEYTMRLPFRYNENYKMTQGYGANPDAYAGFGLAGHAGVDYATPEGTDLVAPISGTVVKVGYDPAGYGNYVVIQNEFGQQATIAHMGKDEKNTGIGVSEGSVVAAGDYIGASGNTGNSTGPHVHVAYRNANIEAPEGMAGYLDPTNFMPSVGDAGTSGWMWGDISNLSYDEITAIVAAGYTSPDALDKAIKEKGEEAVAATLDQNALTDKLIDAQQGWDIVRKVTATINLGQKPSEYALIPGINPDEKHTPLQPGIIPGLSKENITALNAAGVDYVEQLRDMDAANLNKIDGITEPHAQELADNSDSWKAFSHTTRLADAQGVLGISWEQVGALGAANIDTLGELAGAQPFWMDLNVGIADTGTFSQKSALEAIRSAQKQIGYWAPKAGTNPEATEARFNFDAVTGISKERMYQMWDTVMTPDDPNTTGVDETTRLTTAEQFYNADPYELSKKFDKKWSAYQIKKSQDQLRARAGLDPIEMTKMNFTDAAQDDLTAIGMDQTQADIAKNSFQISSFWQLAFWDSADLMENFGITQTQADEWKMTAAMKAGQNNAAPALGTPATSTAPVPPVIPPGPVAPPLAPPTNIPGAPKATETPVSYVPEAQSMALSFDLGNSVSRMTIHQQPGVNSTLMATTRPQPSDMAQATRAAEARLVDAVTDKVATTVFRTLEQNLRQA